MVHKSKHSLQQLNNVKHTETETAFLHIIFLCFQKDMGPSRRGTGEHPYLPLELQADGPRRSTAINARCDPHGIWLFEP